MVVFPALPVTARIFALLRARAARARSSSPRWVWPTVSSGPVTPSGAWVTSAAPALASKAARTKSWPSRLSPFSATNRSPSLSVRVSMESPSTLKAWLAWPRVAASASVWVHRRHAARPPTATRGGNRLLAVGEGMHFAVDILAGLMALAGQHQHIAGRSDSATAARMACGTVADLARARRRRQNFARGWWRHLRCGDCRR